MLCFGYGSLVNRDTRDPSEQFFTASLHGWERCWAHRAGRPWSPPDNTPNSIGTPGGKLASSQSITVADSPSERPGVCALTVVKAAESVLDGVVAHVADEQIAALDLREAGYQRIALPVSHFSCEIDVKDSHISVYVSSPENNNWADPDYPILMSYIECVLAGYRQQFGEDGARRFMQTTIGWDKPIYDDRPHPLYPRSVTLVSEEQQMADALLREFIG